MQEYRFHGRGGQGVVVLSKLVARLFFQLNKQVKEFPKFGVERRGAPVEGYVRVDDSAIELNCQVYEPDAIVVMAESILDTVDVTSGMKAGGLVIVNSGRPAETFARRLAGFRVATIDASSIALEHGLGTVLAPIANTTLFGAFAKVIGVDSEGLASSIRAEIKRPDKNIDAAHQAYETMVPAELMPGEPEKREPPPPLYKTLDEMPALAYSQRNALGNHTGSWRSQKPSYVFRIAPCNGECPAGNDVRGFLEALGRNDPAEALKILLDTSPFPGTCGRVCPHPCEDVCNRHPMDEPIPVMALERFAEAHGGSIRMKQDPDTGKRIAIVGAGPAGLSAAWQLARRGHKVVVYESSPEPGGMLVLGIPAFRLPRDVLKREIDRIVSLGVEIRCNAEVGKEIELDRLAKENDAVLVAVGQQISAHLKIPGEESAVHGLPFLREHNLGGKVEVNDDVIIIGGGNTAVDCAGTALRLSKTRKVKIVYRRSREQMPAIKEEIAQVLAEGVELVELTSPIEVVRDNNGNVKALLCDKMKLEAADASGRPRPVPIPDSRYEIPCSQIILATGQWTDLEFASGLEIDPKDHQTNLDKVLIAGDAHDGAGTVTAAIGAGRRAALAIHGRLCGEVSTEEKSWAPILNETLTADRINKNYFVPHERACGPRLAIDAGLESFEEVVGEIPEGCGSAKHCLSCGTCTGCDNCYLYCPEPAISRADGVYTIDMNYCKGCGICFEECPRGVIDMSEERV